MPIGLLLIIGVGVVLYFIGQQQTGIGVTQAGITPVIEPSIPGLEKFHIVGPGDWLSKIAPQYGLTYERLLQLNPAFLPGGGRDPNKIQVGEMIKVRP